MSAPTFSNGVVPHDADLDQLYAWWPGPAAPAQPLPEAPASANVRVTLCGREVQLTLRDSDEDRLLQRLQAVLQRFPVAQASREPQGRGEGWCPLHNVQMRSTTKNGRSWLSHRTAEGWCKGR
jgi:hypothetical protein